METILTNQQHKILKLTSIGLSAKEIAEEVGSTPNTINTHLKNIKERLGLQKASELVAYYWCEVFGSSLEEQKRQMMSIFLLMIFCTSLQTPTDQIGRRPSSGRSNQVTRTIRTRRS